MKPRDTELMHSLVQALHTLAEEQQTIGPLGNKLIKNDALTPPLIEVLSSISTEDLDLQPTTGLAHDHIRIKNSNFLLRIPIQSQLRMNAFDNLVYQAACFDRMSASLHTPRCHALLAPGKHLPMGGLIVDFINGRALELSRDLVAVANSLAAIHSLPLPPASARSPLISQDHALIETLSEVQEQAVFLSTARLTENSRRAIETELANIQTAIKNLDSCPLSLISFDAHPANFILNESGQAILVDLEKGRYGGAGFDLAHATLYTSTTWSQVGQCELSINQIRDFYSAWHAAMPAELGNALLPYLLPMRKLMWLWSLTWCAKWRVLSEEQPLEDKQNATSAEDWSTNNTDAALVTHVRNRVDHYLAIETIEKVIHEFNMLKKHGIS